MRLLTAADLDHFQHLLNARRQLLSFVRRCQPGELTSLQIVIPDWTGIRGETTPTLSLNTPESMETIARLARDIAQNQIAEVEAALTEAGIKFASATQS